MYQLVALKSRIISISSFFWEILNPTILMIINTDSTVKIATSPTPIILMALIHLVRVETTSCGYLTRDTNGEFFNDSAIDGRSVICLVEISSEDGSMSSVTSSRRTGSFLFCSLYFAKASFFEMNFILAIFPVCLSLS